MRIGSNPAKKTSELQGYNCHRVIVPVYIPHFEGYFQHALEILHLCLESLRLTATPKAAVTIVANGCAQPVIDELNRHYQAGWLDQLIINQHNRGKVDAVVSVARGCFEPLLTISDCDVLFKQGWLETIEDLFATFPECGFACPFPSPAAVWYQTSATLLGAFFRHELRCEKVVLDEELDRFAQSVGQPHFYKPEQREKQIIVRRGEQLACVGAGHFACTLRREIVAAMPDKPSLTAVDNGSEAIWLDSPPDELGLWRLSTPRAWVNHMGNTPETWMREELDELAEKLAGKSFQAPEATSTITPTKYCWPRFIPIKVRRRILGALRREKIRQGFYRQLQWLSRNHSSSGAY